jgi:CHAD domain-containing protein
LRYAVEFFISLLPARRAQKFIDQLAHLQDRLGALNDIATATRLLQAIALQAEKRRSAASRATAAETALAAGLVIGWHRRRSVALLAQVTVESHQLRKLPPII